MVVFGVICGGGGVGFGANLVESRWVCGVCERV